MSLRKLQPAAHACPNLAPMVDVIMVLLVFFLLGASLNLVTEGALKTELDASSGPAAGERFNPVPALQIALEYIGEGQGVLIHLDKDVLNENDFAGLETRMAGKRAIGADTARPVVISADMKVRWRYVVQAMDAALRAGFKNVQFGVSFTSP